jgi:hypothetical protein
MQVNTNIYLPLRQQNWRAEFPLTEEYIQAGVSPVGEIQPFTIVSSFV